MYSVVSNSLRDPGTQKVLASGMIMPSGSVKNGLVTSYDSVPAPPLGSDSERLPPSKSVLAQMAKEILLHPENKTIVARIKPFLIRIYGFFKVEDVFARSISVEDRAVKIAKLLTNPVAKAAEAKLDRALDFDDESLSADFRTRMMEELEGRAHSVAFHSLVRYAPFPHKDSDSAAVHTLLNGNSIHDPATHFVQWADQL